MLSGYYLYLVILQKYEYRNIFSYFKWRTGVKSIVSVAIIPCTHTGYHELYLATIRILLYLITLSCQGVADTLLTLRMFQFILVFSAVGYMPLKTKFDAVKYPTWSEGLGFLMAFVCVSPIPIYMLYKLATEKGTFMQVTAHAQFH